MVDIARLPKPDWLKKRIPSGQACTEVSSLLRDRQLHTVCQEAHCPNLGECFSRGTATFMILGDQVYKELQLLCGPPRFSPSA